MNVTRKHLVEIETTPRQLLVLSHNLRKAFEAAQLGDQNPSIKFEQIDIRTGEITIIEFKVDQDAASVERKKGQW